ncbi:hypothetical protein [Methanoplanus endosymbiosus]|uniref:Uncharacterized protein n=1 Tax=Methanoplanus endosymbiosus TaxID=33865 RepID=A0A9E7PTN0_9EURY|nr:hypothetical protein [Methanoplanus endosymbiosus]UUX93742.1 hypothetical protein L6E24_06405 [Methanoplanus endosymbiosus]
MDQSEITMLNSGFKRIEDQMNRLNSQFSSMNSTLNSINQLQRDVAQAVKESSSTINKLNENIKKIEIEKAKSEINILEKQESIVKSYKDNMEKIYRLEEKILKKAYFDSIKNAVTKFSDSIKKGSVNTKPLRSVIDSNQTIIKGYEEMLSSIDEYNKITPEIYIKRSNDLITKKNNILKQMDNFLRERKTIVDKINGWGTKVKFNSPVVINVPFWVALIEKDGQISTIKIPVSELGEAETEPTEEIPYIEHLAGSKSLNFSDEVNKFYNTEIEKFAVNNQISYSKEDLLSGLKMMQDKKFVHEEFVNTISRFEVNNNE